MVKWSNHAETRSLGLGANDVAEGYISHAVRVLAGEAKLGDTPEERRVTLAKAQRIIRNVARGAARPIGHDHGLAALRRARAEGV